MAPFSTYAAQTTAFFAQIEEATKAEILANVASHYGITPEAALAEVTDDEAESLLDYLTGSVRTATSLLMKRHRAHGTL